MNLGIENETLEFKKTTGELKKAVVSISSMINKHGIATLYFGVSPKEEVLGQDLYEETLRNVSQAIAENIKPQIYPTIEKQTLDGKSVIKIEANGDEMPYIYI
ncbi:MAG: ATP-binding protein [Lachnospiraceae bacterium]|nr:ATP-binding protein [Lachnospiraceae bacterium]